MKNLSLVLIIALVLGIAIRANAAEEKRTAEIIGLNGEASIMAAGQSNWSPARIGTIFNEGDTLKTAANSMATLNVDGKGQTATVEVSEGSQLLLSTMAVDSQAGTSKTLLDLAVGEVLIKAQKVHGAESKFEVKTPTSIVGVRGTTFRVKVEALEE